MRQIIKDVLNIHGEMNVNLASDAARDVIAIEIIEKLKKKGFYYDYRYEESEEQSVKESWVCQTCGKSTFETEYDYLVHPKLHLGCALEVELKGKDIKGQYHKASARLYDEDIRREKNWSQKKHEGKVFDNRIESVEEPEGAPYTPEEIKKWEKEVSKLSEEIVDNKDIKYIYESPDGGKTIYRREFGSDEKELIKNG
jgi:hypothetical protein